jgi:hypothetical protein
VAVPVTVPAGIVHTPCFGNYFDNRFKSVMAPLNSMVVNASGGGAEDGGKPFSPLWATWRKRLP